VNIKIEEVPCGPYSSNSKYYAYGPYTDCTYTINKSHPLWEARWEVVNFEDGNKKHYLFRLFKEEKEDIFNFIKDWEESIEKSQSTIIPPLESIGINSELRIIKFEE